MADTGADELRGRRILIVEDNYLIATQLAWELEELGVLVVGPAGSVADALMLIEGAAIEGATLDVNLGAEKAYPVADALLARRVPFVFTTGYDGWILPAEYADVPRCEKPVDIGSLARILSERMKPNATARQA